MGSSSSLLLFSLDNILENKESHNSSKVQINKRILLARKRRMAGIKQSSKTLMKRRVHVQGSRRPANLIESKVRTLKKLVPHGESMGLERLFRETADYILALQMRVQVMQIMIQELSGPNV